MRYSGKPGTKRAIILLLVALLGVFTAACGSSNSGFPKQAGQYTIQPGSLAFDGKKYEMIWADPSGGLHKAEGEDVRMQQDERTILEIAEGSPIVHLKEDEAVVVRGEDRGGPFESFWFPFFLGSMMGRGAGGPVIVNQPYPGDSASRGPGYQYPPTDRFGRDDNLHGSVQRSKAQTPDYTKVQPAPYAVSGQGAGTGGGNAATNKSVSPDAGQSGGTGAGTAASSKGTFRSGGGGTGVGAGAGWGSSRPNTGTGGSAGRPSVPAPSRGFSGGRRR